MSASPASLAPAAPLASALIMAGGRSSRMRKSFGQTHKALLPVLGLPLIERNLCWLLAQGFRDLYVAVAALEIALIRHVEQRCLPLAKAFGAQLAMLTEQSPLGTLGAGALCPPDGDLVVVNVDNLTSIDLRAMLAQHRGHAAAMTIATHDETFRMPFGHVLTRGETVLAIAEKPETTYQISSGTYVLGPVARQVIVADRRNGPVELFGELRELGHATLAYRHAAPWIDVNDADALGRAATLVAAHQPELECHWAAPRSERVLLCGTEKATMLVGRPQPARRSLGGARRRWPYATFVASFDEPLLNGQVTRCHLFRRPPNAGGGVRGFRPLREEPVLRGSRVEARCLAYLEHALRQEAT